MNRTLTCAVVALGILVLPGLLRAVEIKARVLEATGDSARLATESEYLPSVGDTVELFFEIPGLNEQVSVATGRVSDTSGEAILVTIERATGKVATNQLARITSLQPRKKALATPGQQPSAGAGVVGAPSASRTIHAPTNQAWTATGVVTQEGAELAVTASGKIEASPSSDTRAFYHQVPPEGRSQRLRHFPHPDLPGLALIGRLGSGPAFFVGSSFRFRVKAEDAGKELFLGINDDVARDNSGAWTVEIMVNAPSNALPKVVPSEPPGRGPAATGIRPRPTGDVLYFQDNFDAPQPSAVAMFPGQVMSFTNVDGKGRLVSTSAGVLPALYETNNVKDFFAEFEMLVPSGQAETGYGLLFRGQRDSAGGLGSYYMLLVHPRKGNMTFSCWQTPQWTFSQQFPLPPNMLLPRQPNRVRLEAVGADFRVFVNDRFAFHLTDQKLSAPGMIGLCVSASLNQPDAVYFDNLRVWMANNGFEGPAVQAAPAESDVRLAPPPSDQVPVAEVPAPDVPSDVPPMDAPLVPVDRPGDVPGAP